MKIEVNINKRFAFAILGAILLVGGIFFVNAYGSGNPGVMGHSVDEINWDGMITGYLKQNVLNAALYDVWLQGGANVAGGPDRNLALAGNTQSDRLFVNYNSEYSGGTVIGGPVDVLTAGVSGKLTAGQYCIGTNCIGSWPVDTNAQTVCASGQYLNGDGQCKTASQIVHDGAPNCVRRDATSAHDGQNGGQFSEVSCNANEILVGGGGICGGSSQWLQFSRPSSSVVGGSWYVGCSYGAGSDTRAYAICCIF